MLILLPDVERLEFSGIRNTDGTLIAFGNSAPMEDWPNEITVCPKDVVGGGVKFRLEDSNDFSQDDYATPGSVTSQAWYVPAE